MPIALFDLLPAGNWIEITTLSQRYRTWKERADGQVRRIYLDGRQPPVRDPPDAQAKQNADATLAFWRSPLFADLRCGNKVVWARRFDQDPTKPPAALEALSPGTWHGAFSISRSYTQLAVYIGARTWACFTDCVVHAQEDPPCIASAPPDTHSGMPGRPTSRHLYEAELERRHTTGEMLPAVGQEAEALLAWLKSSHPNLAAGRPRSIENNIRDQHRALKARMK
jgi:hypothetical protein